MKNIVIFGSGGHSKVILSEILESKNDFKFCGFVDSSKKTGSIVTKVKKKNYKIINLKSTKIKDLYGIIGIGDNFLRYKNYQIIKSKFKYLKWAKIISKKSNINANVKIGTGSVILANSFIGSGSKINKHCIINSSTSIDHDNSLESFSSTGPGVITGGNVKLKKFSHLGIGCVVKNNITICENVICGGKSYVNKNCKKNSLYFGVPSKFIKSRKLGQKYL